MATCHGGDVGMQSVEGFIVLLDISGYTRYIRSHNLRHVPVVGKHFRKTSESHAEAVVTDLLAVLINATSDLLHPEKLEGDAVLMTAIVEDSERFAHGAAGFVHRLSSADRGIVYLETCLCDCCSQMKELRVKAIAHHGAFLLQKVAGFRGCGPGGHTRPQALKNEVDSNEYLMLTDAVANLAEAPSVMSMESHVETDKNLGTTKVWVHTRGPQCSCTPHRAIPTASAENVCLLEDKGSRGSDSCTKCPPGVFLLPLAMLGEGVGAR